MKQTMKKLVAGAAGQALRNVIACAEALNGAHNGADGGFGADR